MCSSLHCLIVYPGVGVGRFTISTHACGLGGRAHSQVSGWAFMPGVPNNSLNAWILLVAFSFLIFICSVSHLTLHEDAEEDKWWLSS